MVVNQQFCSQVYIIDPLSELLEALYQTRKQNPQSVEDVQTVVNSLFPDHPLTLSETETQLAKGSRAGLWFVIRANPLEVPLYQFDPAFLQNNWSNRKYVSPMNTFEPTHNFVKASCFCLVPKGSTSYGRQ